MVYAAICLLALALLRRVYTTQSLHKRHNYRCFPLPHQNLKVAAGRMEGENDGERRRWREGGRRQKGRKEIKGKTEKDGKEEGASDADEEGIKKGINFLSVVKRIKRSFKKHVKEKVERRAGGSCRTAEQVQKSLWKRGASTWTLRSSCGRKKSRSGDSVSVHAKSRPSSVVSVATSGIVIEVLQPRARACHVLRDMNVRTANAVLAAIAMAKCVLPQPGGCPPTTQSMNYAIKRCSLHLSLRLHCEPPPPL